MFVLFYSLQKSKIVMETNINESLGIDGTTTSSEEIKDNSSAEKQLIIIANIVLIIGIIGALIMAFTITYTTIEGEYSWRDKTVVNSMGIIITIVTLISSVTIWGLLKVICNISTSLKEINIKTK